MPVVPKGPVLYDFADVVLEALQREAIARAARGDRFPKADQARIIREQDALRLDKQARAPAAASKQAARPFGDPKQIPPQPEWVTAYSKAIGYPLDGVAWCDSYEVKGWEVGKSKTRMKNWHAAVRTWKANKYGFGGIALGATKKDRDYSRV